MHIFHGGLQHIKVRYRDGESRRLELSDTTAVIVQEIAAEYVELEPVNLDVATGRTVVVQRRSFGLGGAACVRITMDLSVNTSSYEVPWSWSKDEDSIIRFCATGQVRPSR
jgi:hypothetical protein